MADPPTGTVTFLFTDIEGSTRLWERSPEAMSEALARHDEILADATEACGGHVFKTVGDAFCCAFPTAPEALEAALLAQRGLLSEDWGGEVGPLRVRMALHAGSAEERGGDYFGPPVNRVARLLSAAHGGQVLLSHAAEELVRDELPEGASLRDLGERRLKDLFRPKRVFQLVAPELLSSFPPLKTLDARLNNLPAQPTPLVGREKEVAEACGHLRRPDARLLTLTGPGGTGKTRLGLQAAADLLDEFEDGVFFVALAPITDLELVASAIAGPLGMVESGEQPLEVSLKAYLQDKELLLLLDNFEQVLKAAPLVGELLGSCPRLKVLATSRAALRVYGEQEYAVPPLILPDPRRLPALERLGQYEAVRLFIERARAVKTDFEMTNANAPAVAEICVRLDGLPLAIELAAARTRLLAPQAMLSRLGSRLKLLKGGGRDLPARQQTLRGAIEWSHDLLDDEERTLFRRLSVFVGGFTLEAAEAVCNSGSEPEVDVLDVAESLLGKSLLRREEGADEGRMWMLETIREYALERLEESSEAQALRRLHAEYLLALAEEAEPELKGPDQAEWLERLKVEQDNVRTSLSWAFGPDDAALGVQLARAQWWFWFLQGHFEEGRRWLEQALSRGTSSPAAARVGVLSGVAWLAMAMGDYGRAEAACEESRELSTTQAGVAGDVVAFLRITQGIVAREQGDHGRAVALLEEGLALSREAADEWAIGLSLLNLAGVESYQGNREQAMRLFEDGLALSRRLGEAALLAAFLVSLGYEVLLWGDHERATELNEEAATLLRERGHNSQLQMALDNLGWAALLRREPERAEALLAESLTLGQRLGDKVSITESLDGLACVAGARRETRRAARLFGAAQALRASVGFRLPPAAAALREPFLAAASSRLDEAAWARMWEEGEATTLEDAIAYALQEDRA